MNKIKILLTVIITIIFSEYNSGQEANFRFEAPTLTNVVKSLSEIDTIGNKLGVWSDGFIPYPYYALNMDNDFGRTHFQGMQRLQDKNYIVISGSNIARLGNTSRYGIGSGKSFDDLIEPEGNLFIARLTSKKAIGEFGSNIDTQTEKPDELDRIIYDIKVKIKLPSGTYLWHPGGISVYGDILVVPTENYSAELGKVSSQILFYDVSNPEQPKKFNFIVDRTGDPIEDKAGAAALVRMDDGFFLLLARSTTHSYLYISNSTNFLDGFNQEPLAIIDEKTALSIDGKSNVKFGGSGVNFVKQKNGELFLFGFSSVKLGGSKMDPMRPQRSFARLFKLSFENGNISKPIIQLIKIKEFAQKQLDPKGYGHFGAAGIYVTADDGLALYCTPRWQVSEIGDHELENIMNGKFFKIGDKGFIPFIEFWKK
ncbi:MAG: hypothetical protein K9J12_17990 [Melioribacteraceae bacterium]|nr:hypothetical protein [Melioribacteraceae bacterium]MCF8264194.1 hypothetical protein [Melioribacteraceae bacterium]